MAMTVREQLAEQASRPGRKLERDFCHFPPGKRMVLILPPGREITLTTRMRDTSPFLKLIRVGAVNSAEVCGIPSNHLLITKFWIERIDPPDITGTGGDAVDYPVHVELLNSPSPLRGGPEIDFDAMLDVLDGKPEAPPSETWHDRPRLL